MEINGPQLPPRPAGTPQLNALAQLRVGQILQAVVLKATVDKIALLQVRNQQIRVETQAPLTQGQRIEAEVVQIGANPILKLRTPIQTPSSAPQAINTAMKQALPKQMGLAPLLANLRALSRVQSASNLLPPLISEAIKKVISSLPQRGQVTTASGLKEALRNSGLFLENKLSASKSNEAGTLAKDVKTSLLQLIAQTSASTKAAGQTPVPQATLITTEAKSLATPPLRPAKPQPQGKALPTTSGMSNLLQILGEVGKQAEGALARLNLLQLTSLPQQDQSNPLWFFELPIHDQDKTDIFQLIVEEESNEQEDAQNKQWGIMLSFDLENLGPMYVKLNYFNEQISATVWAENSKTAAFVNRELSELSKRFEQAEVEIGKLHCQQGTPSETEITSVNQTVLDIKV